MNYFPLFIWYGGASFITFCVYAFDKSAAKKGQWRISEKTLHLLALLGGWLGAFIAQKTFRHKTQKQPFRAIFWLTVILNCAALVGLFSPAGTEAMRFLFSSFPRRVWER